MKKKTRRLIARHAAAGFLAAAFVGAFWASRPQWSADMRLWKSFGDSALLLLALSLIIGPMAKFSRRWARIVERGEQIDKPRQRQRGLAFGGTADKDAIPAGGRRDGLLPYRGLADAGFAVQNERRRQRRIVVEERAKLVELRLASDDFRCRCDVVRHPASPPSKRPRAGPAALWWTEA